MRRMENSRAPLLCFSSFVHNFVAIDEFKLELQSGNAQFRSKSAIFWFRVTFKFDGWPRETTGHLSSAASSFVFYFIASSFVCHFIAISEFKLELQSPNAQFGSKSTIFFSTVTLKFDRGPWKTTGHLLYATSSFVHHFVAINEFKLGWQFGNPEFASKQTIFLVVWPWNLTDDLEK